MKRNFITTLILLVVAMATNAVTLNVTVPGGTKKCFVAGNFNGWNAGNAVEMQKTGEHTFSLTLNDVDEAEMSAGYKYLCGQDWAYVEKGASGEEIANRTTISNMDIVASWAKLYNPDIVETKLKVNGYDRIVKIFLPSDYATSQESYPVVYMTGVQARYNNAGSDSDRGDDHMGEQSWNIPGMAYATEGGIPCIFVSIYGFTADNIPFEYEMFAGSGSADEFINGIETELIPFINKTYRTLTGPVHTSIVGGDMGGLLSLYAALSRPDLFGQAAALSPTLWINKEQLISFVETVDTDYHQRFYLSVGDAEPEEFRSDVEEFKNVVAARRNTDVRFTVFGGASHNDEAWGKAFKSIYPFLLSADAEYLGEKINLLPMQKTTSQEFSSTDYSIVSAVDSQNLKFDANTKFSYITNFASSEGEVEAQVAITEIPVEIKTKYYWNVSRSADGSGVLLKAENGDIGFSSKKTTTSWHRVVVFSDETVKDVAANSAAFRIVTASDNIKMSVIDSFKVKATVDFIGEDKSFTIHYGSVNSGSDMGAITNQFNVSANCTAAEITYDFLTNQVLINETKWGETISKVVVDKFIAVPSICNVGSDAKVTLHIADLQGSLPEATISHNYGEKISQEFMSDNSGNFSFNLSNLKSGIYHISLNLRKGESLLNDVATIAIKVLNGIKEEKEVVNPYKSIDWSNINQYKSNFHTHTTRSFDANLRTDQVVDQYYNAGYQILALTEHDANPYPWEYFNLYDPYADNRYPSDMQMLAIPGNELSKNYRNSWNEEGGSEYNHHNDFFTGRQGQEFATLQESYAYTQQLGGMQIINHPGQYWNLSASYNKGDKNSPEWHAENFITYNSLIGLEVYNQGNRRPNDRILWDQILNLTTPQGINVYGYSGDDSHNTEQLFRNYNFMLMPELSIDALKTAMREGSHYFCYEYAGSGEAKAPRITDINVDEIKQIITIDTDADEIYWISATDISNHNIPNTRKSTIIAVGKEFNYSGFQGNYVRALIVNEFGETCTQPIIFKEKKNNTIETIESDFEIVIYPNPATDVVNIKSNADIKTIAVYDMLGRCVKYDDTQCSTIDITSLMAGNYIVSIETCNGIISNRKLIINRD